MVSINFEVMTKCSLVVLPMRCLHLHVFQNENCLVRNLIKSNNNRSRKLIMNKWWMNMRNCQICPHMHEILCHKFGLELSFTWYYKYCNWGFRREFSKCTKTEYKTLVLSQKTIHNVTFGSSELCENSIISFMLFYASIRETWSKIRGNHERQTPMSANSFTYVLKNNTQRYIRQLWVMWKQHNIIYAVSCFNSRNMV